MHRFVLTKGPLLRFTLVRLDGGRHMLVFTHHHALLDGWSLPVLFHELLTLYVDGGAVHVFPRVRPYAEDLQWLARQDRGPALDAGRKYLATAEPTPVGAATSGKYVCDL